MTDKEKNMINFWLCKVENSLRLVKGFVKYPNSRLGDAIDILTDSIADFPFDLEV